MEFRRVVCRSVRPTRHGRGHGCTVGNGQGRGTQAARACHAVDARGWPGGLRPEGARVEQHGAVAGMARGLGRSCQRAVGRAGYRSEEHTSELQSLMRISYAVFCLKKKKNMNTKYSYIHTYVTHNIECITYKSVTEQKQMIDTRHQ